MLRRIGIAAIVGLALAAGAGVIIDLFLLYERLSGSWAEVEIDVAALVVTNAAVIVASVLAAMWWRRYAAELRNKDRVDLL